MQHFTQCSHPRLTTHSFPPISHSLIHPSALLSQLWTSSVANKEQWEISLANKGSCLISCQWRSLPSLTWPKQKMQPSAPFTTDWMTSATVPEHTSACGKTHRDSPFTVNFQSGHIEEKKTENRWNRYTENNESKMILCKQLFTIGYTNSHQWFQVFFITQEYVRSCVFVCAEMCGLVLQSVSAWVLWGKASAAEAPSHTSHCKQGL